jgi:phosphate transport system permease protein
LRIKPGIIDKIARIGFNAQAFFTVGILVVIITIIFIKGFTHINLEFIFSSPEDMGRHGGIFPSIIGTVLLALLSIVFATPLGLGTAIFLTEYTKESAFTRIIRFGVESLSGIPSIIYGLFGFIFFVIKLKMGWCLLSGVLTMTIMILPTIIRTSEEAIKAVPRNLRIVSYSLGATRWETAAVIFTMGSSLRLPTSLMDSGRTMAVHFYILAREGISMDKAYATALILVLSITVINILAYYIMNKVVSRYS